MKKNKLDAASIEAAIKDTESEVQVRTCDMVSELQ